MFTRRWADRDELGRVPATEAFMDAFLAPEARLINFLVGDLHDKLKPIGKLDLLAEISNRVRAYYQNFADRERSPEALKQWSTALINQGDVFTDQGDLAAALKCYEESLAIRQNLFQQNSQGTDSQRDVATWITALQLKAITNRRINFFMDRLPGRLISSFGNGNPLDAKGASTSIHAPFATLGQ